MPSRSATVLLPMHTCHRVQAKYMHATTESSHVIPNLCLRRQLCAVCRLPLLQDGSVVIRESCAIMLYLLETYGGQA